MADSPPAGYSRRTELGLLLLAALWLCIGVFGHDPWKPDEADRFGVVYSLLQSGDVLVPRLAGEPLVESPPLYTATAALFAKLLSPWFALHDGARLATTLYVGLALAVVGAAAAVLHGHGTRWVAVLALAGSLGLWDRAHHLLPEAAVVFAFSLAALGLALADRRPVIAGAVLGCGAGIGFLAHGLFTPVALAATALVLLAIPAWRTPARVVSLGVALAASLPWLLIWPALLRARSPELFADWFWVQGVEHVLGGIDAPWEGAWLYLRDLPWFAWPAWPLAFWTVTLRARGYRGGLGAPAVQMPLVMAAVILVLLVVGGDPHATLAMPLLVPLALLGAAEIDTLERGRSAALDWFGIVTWGVVAVGLWILWLQTATTGMAPAIARLLKDGERGFVSPVEPGAVAASLALTLLWVALVRPARRSSRRALLNWFAGALLAWGMLMTLWLPYQESRRSYRSVAAALRSQLPPQPGCIASRNLGEAQRGAFHYFADLVTVREEVRPVHECRYLVAQASTTDSPAMPGWALQWEGSRPGDRVERFRLYRRTW